MDPLMHSWGKLVRTRQYGEFYYGGLLRALGYLKALWQMLHTRGFSLLWINIC